ncbi:hypothetical protein DL96DRAFT_1818313 [Flagelloscypha sp. PMI_526]|nr:hypothetical protein DL96DRAFT_1818313 [Flagelloscypha sp. PMI_526]
MAASPNSILPEDIEEEINAILLHNVPSMSGTMSLVASRFHTWSKPVQFHTIVIRRQKGWTSRVQELVHFAPFIRVLAFNLFNVHGDLNEEDIDAVRLLISACTETVKHLALTWMIWSGCQSEINRLHLKSLYIFWDWASGPQIPSLVNLQYPEELKDLTMFSPAYVDNFTAFHYEGALYLPDIKRCTNLEYVTYAADRYTSPTVGSLCEDYPNLKGVMFLLVNIPKEHLNEDKELDLWEDEKYAYANFSSAYLPRSAGILSEWVAKIEGRESVLVHPPPHELEDME